MKTIWKFPIAFNNEQLIPMPKGATIIYADMQGEMLCLWAIVDKKNAGIAVERRIFVRGTGYPLGKAEGKRYIGSFKDRIFVWHLFAEDEQT